MSDTIKRLRGELLLTHGRDRAEFRWLDVSRLVDIAALAQAYLDKDEFTLLEEEALIAALKRLAESPTK